MCTTRILHFYSIPMYSEVGLVFNFNELSPIVCNRFNEIKLFIKKIYDSEHSFKFDSVYFCFIL